MTSEADEATDEELVRRARAGHDASLHRLLLRHQRLARMRARAYFVAGAEHEDVVQEGMIGLYKAVQEFDPGRDASFRTFADLCVSRQIVSAVRAASRRKHGPLNGYVPFHRPVPTADGGERPWEEALPASPLADPAEQLLCAERIRDLRRHVDTALSDLETEVLRLHVEGMSYQDIARRLQRRAKSVDNALQRIKRKLDAHLHSREPGDRGAAEIA